MSRQKIALALMLILGLLIPSQSWGGFISKERITTYQVQFDLIWYQKFLSFFLKFESLSWKEIDAKELFIKTTGESPQMDSEDAELILISLMPKNFDEAMFLDNAGKTVGGFIRFIKKRELSQEGVKTLLQILNYLYKPEEGEKEFNNLDLLEGREAGDKLLNWKISKKKVGDKYLIDLYITGAAKDGKISEMAYLKILMNPLEKTFEQASAEIKNGPKFTVTKKPS